MRVCVTFEDVQMDAAREIIGAACRICDDRKEANGILTIHGDTPISFYSSEVQAPAKMRKARRQPTTAPCRKGRRPHAKRTSA